MHTNKIRFFLCSWSPIPWSLPFPHTIVNVFGSSAILSLCYDDALGDRRKGKEGDKGTLAVQWKSSTIHLFFKRLLSLLRFQMAIQLEYRAVMWIWLFSGFALPLINMAVWTSVSQSGEVAGYSSSDFVSYFLAVMAVDHAVAEWTVYHWEWMVRRGDLSPKLLRPIDPIWELAMENLGYKVAQGIITVPIWILLWFLLKGSPYQLTILTVMGFLTAVVLAGILNFLIGYTFSLTAFWIIRVGALYEMLAWGIGYFFSGRMAPLGALPDWVVSLSYWLPFPYTMAFPVDALMGRCDQEEWLRGFLSQIAWILVFCVVRRVLWGLGLRKYTAVGG
ncbi:MAG: ABC-2 family transporter protein [Armatimonadetes bacterium]|nr:ABC-2 family transporter protein [Armatimonadota bacterium]MDW8123010.1 ABC-2 family transporter protein [Armatimonadota bacterium]